MSIAPPSLTNAPKQSISMACFTFAPMRAALPQVARPKQQKLALPAFSGLRASSSLPQQLAGGQT